MWGLNEITYEKHTVKNHKNGAEPVDTAVSLSQKTGQPPGPAGARPDREAVGVGPPREGQEAEQQVPTQLYRYFTFWTNGSVHPIAAGCNWSQDRAQGKVFFSILKRIQSMAICSYWRCGYGVPHALKVTESLTLYTPVMVSFRNNNQCSEWEP